MKYRVRLDLSFASEGDALSLMEKVKSLAASALNVNAGRENEETSYFQHELCRHEEGLPCTLLERQEVSKSEVKQ